MQLKFLTATIIILSDGNPSHQKNVNKFPEHSLYSRTSVGTPSTVLYHITKHHRHQQYLALSTREHRECSQDLCTSVGTPDLKMTLDCYYQCPNVHCKWIHSEFDKCFQNSLYITQGCVCKLYNIHVDAVRTPESKTENGYYFSFPFVTEACIKGKKNLISTISAKDVYSITLFRSLLYMPLGLWALALLLAPQF